MVVAKTNVGDAPDDAALVERIRRGVAGAGAAGSGGAGGGAGDGGAGAGEAGGGAGEDDAHAVLVRRYERQVALIARSILGDRAEAEDMTQEAFVRAFRNLDLLADPAKFGPWLRRIAFGVSIDWVRAFRPQLYRGEGDERALEVLTSAAPGPHQQLAARELAERVRAALAALPPKYRVPLTLFHVDGLSHARVAAALGVPESTARSLVLRARRKLAPRLASYARETFASAAIEEVFMEALPTPPKLLHVMNGTSMCPIFDEAKLPGGMTVYADPLHDGPVPAGLSDEAMRDVRATFLAGTAAAPARADILETLREWDAALAAFREYDEVVLWFEHDLFDQALLMRHLAWFERHAPEDTRLSLICIGAFPGIEGFKGLGQLDGHQLASLFDTRAAVGVAQLALGRRAWEAFTAPDPTALERLVAGDTSALPFLGAALRRHLQEFPAIGSGLPRTEREILHVLAAEGPQAPGALFRAEHRREDCFFIGDTSFRDRLSALAAPPRPLITLELEAGDKAVLPRGRVTITDAGRAVLAGEEDWLAMAPFDRWLGGVHLTRGAIWRWDDARGRIVRD